MRELHDRLPVLSLVTLFALASLVLPSIVLATPTPPPGSALEAQTLFAQGESLYEAKEYEQARVLFERTADLYRALGDRSGEADSLKKVGWCTSALGLHDEAYRAYQLELVIRRELGDLRGEGLVHLNIGSDFARAGKLDRAAESTRRAISILEKAGDQEETLVAHVYLASYLRDLDDYLGALQVGRAGLPLATALKDQRREGLLWRGLGISFRNLERYEEALQAYDHALEIWRELADPAEEARELGNQAITYRHMGEPFLAAEAYAAAARIEGDLGDLEDQAHDQSWAGGLYLKAFRYELAIDSLKMWLESGFADGDLSIKAAAWNDLGVCYLGIGDYGRAQEAVLASLNLKRQIGDREGEAASLGNLGAISSDLGDYEAALEYYDQALRLQREMGDSEDEAQTLDNIGRTQSKMGALDQAWSFYQQSLDLRRENGDRQGEVKVLNNLGDLQQELGHTAEALDLLQLALEISRSVGYRQGEMTALERIGRIHAANGDLEAAVASYEAAFESADKVGDQAGKASILNNLGWSYYLLGDFGKASGSYRQALQIARGLRNRGMQGAILYGMGALEMRSGSYDDALESFLEALQIDREDNYRVGEADSLYSIGLLYEEQGEDESALRYYLASLEIREAIRESIRLEAFRSAVASGDMFVYQRAIELLLRMGRFQEAFDLTERSRSRSFLDQMGNGTPTLREGVAAGFLEHEEQLLHEIAALEDDLLNGSALVTGERTASTLEAFQARLAAKRQEYVDLLAEIELANPELASLVTVTSMNLASIQAALASETTLVSYYILEDSITAFVVSREAFSAVEIPGTADAYRQAVEDFRTLGLANLGNAHPASLVTLYQGLVTPILPYLGTGQVGIIPHQWLHYVPFAALSDGEKYLGEQFDVYTLPSASMLQFLEPAVGDASASPLILGNPATDNPELPSLAFAAEEAMQVAELLAVDPLIGAEASESALQSRAGNASILHLAAHGSFDSQSPLFSRIWLAPTEDADGRLNVHEVYGLDLDQAELVILSACQTSLGELSAGDDVVGLNRAFLYGAPTVVASLWSVDDEATGTLMEAFYANLLNGMGKAEALQGAQETVRTDASHPAWAHPYYWAAFVLSGDPGQVAALRKQAAEGTAAAPWVFVLAGLVLAGGLGFFGFKILKRRQLRPWAGVEKVNHDSRGL